MTTRIEISRMFCKHCRTTTRHEKQIGGTSHVLHLLLTLLTMGLWIFVWFICAANNTYRGTYCSVCGTKNAGFFD